MRIVDKRRDYYDVTMGLGYDPSVVYVRTEKVIKTTKRYVPGRVEHIHVGFCGEVYPAWVLRAPENEGLPGVGAGRGVCYSIEEIDAFVEGRCSKRFNEMYHNEGKEWDYRFYRRTNWRWSRNSWMSRKSFVESWERPKRENWTYSRLKALFVEHNAPIFVSTAEADIINPLLRSYEFYRIKDAYTAYQEIAMYVGGVLRAPSNPVPEISDEDMRDAKGFDDWSFRKEPKA